MSESMHVLPSANAGVSKSKPSSFESGSTPVSNDESSTFDDALASYSDTEKDVNAQNNEAGDTDTGEFVPQDLKELGNMLPQDENAIMWQALMIVLPEAQSKSVTLMPSATLKPSGNKDSLSQLQSVSLLDLDGESNPDTPPTLLHRSGFSGGLERQEKSTLNPNLLNQSYFNSMLMQNKDAAVATPDGIISNNINMQLAAAHFNPEMNESLILNLSEQHAPVQGASTLLSQSLAAVGLGTATQAATAQTQMAPLNLGQNAWETNFSSRLQMMVGQNIQTAEIRLDPPELGSLDIKIKITNDIASVNITSANAQVREALETAVPKLREMFEESGLSLGDVNVQQESFAEHQNTEEEQGNFGHSVGSDQVDEQSIITRKIVNDNLLDIYA